jgi:hypothetical protein
MEMILMKERILMKVRKLNHQSSSGRIFKALRKRIQVTEEEIAKKNGKNRRVEDFL